MGGGAGAGRGEELSQGWESEFPEVRGQGISSCQREGWKDEMEEIKRERSFPCTFGGHIHSCVHIVHILLFSHLHVVSYIDNGRI